MQFEQIKEKIDHYNSQGKSLFASSSFQTHSIPMLHILSRIDRQIPVIFINTGYHFPQTIQYRDQVGELLGLNIVDVKSPVARNLQKDANGHLYFASDPDYCCYLNKVQPLEPVLIEKDVWINGVRAEQSASRQRMQVEQQATHGCLRFHPMLGWTAKMIYRYISEHDLPKHPLELSGYTSIGCEPCTRKFAAIGDRSGRWFGLTKTECGLHTELIDN